MIALEGEESDRNWRRRPIGAEGGIRTRKAFRPTDFLTTTAFAARAQARFVVWTMPSPCIARAMFRREPSRLYTLLGSIEPNLSSALPSAQAEKVSPTLTPFTPEFPAEVLKLTSSPSRMPFPPPRHRWQMIPRNRFGAKKHGRRERSLSGRQAHKANFRPLSGGKA